MIALPRLLARPLAAATIFVASLAPALALPAAAAEPPTALYALTTANSIATITDNASSRAAEPQAVTGITAGEILMAIDVRPQNGRLYGLATTGTGAVRLYHIDFGSGAPVATALSAAPVQFDDGTAAVPIAGTAFDIDFNPTVDRLRVVSNGGFNFRMNPNNGTLVDGNNGVTTTPPPAGVNPDGSIKGLTTTVDATAYTNNSINVAATTQYTLDSTTNNLFIQNPPNSGTQTTPLPLTVGGTAIDFTGDSALDIPPGVNVSTGNTPATGAAFAALTVAGTPGLYQIELSTGATTLLGTLGTLSARDIAVYQLPATGIVLSADGTLLRRFLVEQPTVIGTASTTPAIVGLTAGEVLVGIDGRPATGQLFGLGVNDTANTATLYLLDPQSGAATAVGTPSTIAFVSAAGAPVDLPAASVGYGVDFNPTVDRVRVVTASGLNFRLNPVNGAAVDADTTAAGINPDGPISGASSTVDATAYTNSYAGTTRTTQYTLDSTSNRLFIQNPPNNGVQTTPLTVTLNAATLDFTAANGFDIPPTVAVTTSNTVATGGGYAALTVGNVSGLYRIDLATGNALLLGTLGDGAAPISGLVVWNSPPLRYKVGLPFIVRNP